MSLYERYGTRDLTFSGWHRPPNLPEFCSMIDIDALEYCYYCGKLLALFETARDVGQKHKPTTVLCRLAVQANIPAFLILYKKENDSIGNCRIQRIWPDKTEMKLVSPAVLKKIIVNIHEKCPCKTGKEIA